LQGLDISGDVDRLDVDELDNAVLFEPGEEIAGSPVIGQPGVLVADRAGEEFEEPARACSPAPAIAAGTANLLRNEGIRTGAAASTTAGRLRRSALTATPYN